MYSECRRFLLRLPFHAQRKTLRGNWKVMFTHIWLSQPVLCVARAKRPFSMSGVGCVTFFLCSRSISLMKSRRWHSSRRRVEPAYLMMMALFSNVGNWAKTRNLDFGMDVDRRRIQNSTGRAAYEYYFMFCILCVTLNGGFSRTQWCRKTTDRLLS